VSEERFISVVIPNRNGETTLSRSIEAALSSSYRGFEVVVVDDGSTDSSVEIARRYPVKVIELREHQGVSEARNTGARKSGGEILFFIDSDCLLQEDTLARVNAVASAHKLVGGTYTPHPPENGFFSTFQSLYVNFAETRKATDYVATHAMAIMRGDFLQSGGFVKTSTMGHTTSIEDVEFSHRLKREGFQLEIAPQIQVGHIFNFDFARAMKNAFKKSYYWTLYSLKNRDIFKDSGAASSELKLDSLVLVLSVLFLILGLWFVVPLLYAFNLYQARSLLSHFRAHKGKVFASISTLYFFFLYPLPVLAGGASGVFRYALLKGGGR